MTCFEKRELMSEEEFDLLRELIHGEFGIFMRGDKRLTLHTKVSHRLGILGIAAYRDYYDYIMADGTGEELVNLAAHITNNETYFFREKAQLEAFAELLRDLKAERQKRGENLLRVLSLASSSGEEAYSLNIIIRESGFFMWDWDIRIIGMDICGTAVQKAVSATYTRNSFRSVNGNNGLIEKYFSRRGDQYILRRSLTTNVEFRHGNIMKPSSYEDLRETDAIFCRNALIYMSDEAIGRLARNFYDALSDRGYLFIGSSESLIQKTNLFVPEYVNGIIVYRKNLRRDVSL